MCRALFYRIMKKIKLLVACEESGIVTAAFRKRGIEAYSCDIIPTSGSHPEWHIQGDILKVLEERSSEFTAMIAFPPCTYLSNAGNGWFNIARHGHKAIERHKLRIDAASFFFRLATAKIEHIAVENPVGYMNTYFRKPDLIFHPFYFGPPAEKKRTCLWLKNFPLLTWSLDNTIFGPRTGTDEPQPKGYHENGKKKGKPIYFSESLGRHHDRAKIRSRTFQQVAEAMATQWGEYLKEEYHENP